MVAQEFKQTEMASHTAKPGFKSPVLLYLLMVYWPMQITWRILNLRGREKVHLLKKVGTSSHCKIYAYRSGQDFWQPFFFYIYCNMVLGTPPSAILNCIFSVTPHSVITQCLPSLCSQAASIMCYSCVLHFRSYSHILHEPD